MSSMVDYLERQRALIERRLEALLPLGAGFNRSLFESARYALLGSGKRLRPILTLAAVEMLGGDSDQALSPACTLELVHTYSLIHDDLPCMDDDDYRRGKLAVHKKYSEGHALLTGDFLLTYAFELLAGDPQLDSEKKVLLIAALAKYSGSDGMIGGQVFDLASTDTKISFEELQLLHLCKTGALITAALEFGGILGHADPSQLEALRRFGASAGMAFQIVDDILDVTSSEQKHGRAVPSDILNQKVTYASLLGIEEATAHAGACHREAVAALAPWADKASRLLGIADFIVHRRY